MDLGQRITFRLRPKRDKDLIEAIQEVEEGEISNLVRKGLRMVLGGVRQKEETKKEAPKTVWKLPIK